MTSMDLESAVGDEVVSSRFHQGPRTRVAPRPDIRLQPPLLRQNIKTLPCKTGGVHISGCQFHDRPGPAFKFLLLLKIRDEAGFRNVLPGIEGGFNPELNRLSRIVDRFLEDLEKSK